MWYSWIPWNLSFYYILFHEKKAPNDAVTPQRQSQFTPKMKANAVPRLLSSLVWIDQYNECNGMTSFMEFMRKKALDKSKRALAPPRGPLTKFGLSLRPLSACSQLIKGYGSVCREVLIMTISQWSGARPDHSDHKVWTALWILGQISNDHILQIEKPSCRNTETLLIE